VPPPPVAGATVGTGLAVGLGDGLAVGLGLVVGLVVGLGEVVGLADAVGLALALDEGDGEPLAPGEMAGGVAEGVEPEQAERPTEPTMAKATQPTVNLALSGVPMMAGYAINAPLRRARITLAGPERPSWPVSRQTTQRYRLGEEQGER
jgi:hypothetical protein